MSVRTLMVVAFALVFGGSAAVAVNSVVNSNRAASAQIETVPVLVAAVDIPRGGTITSELVKTRQFPKGLAPPGILGKTDEAVDRAVISPLVKDEPVLDGKLAPKGSGRGMAALVPPGMRAFTIQTTNVASGVAGFVMPGNRVDVLLTMNGVGTKEQTGGGVTTTLLQNVEILAVDQRIDAPVDNKVDPAQLRSVTLLVTPEEAARLDLGQNRGSLHLSLRNPEDTRPAQARTATLTALEGLQPQWDQRAKGVIEALGKALAQRKPAEPPAPAAEAAAPPEAQAPPVRMVRIYRGTQWSWAN